MRAWGADESPPHVEAAAATDTAAQKQNDKPDRPAPAQDAAKSDRAPWCTEILDLLRKEPCIIVLGETGCGKTTMLPQLLLEAGYDHVCATQPRRVAAIAAARRVAHLRGGRVGGEVGYAIRFEQVCGPATRIKFVTDGVLLREASSQPALPQYGALVLDEAHERSLNTDVLFAISHQLLAAPAGAGPQRIVVASATLDAEKFSRFFGGAPIVRVDSRPFPVQA